VQTTKQLNNNTPSHTKKKKQPSLEMWMYYHLYNTMKKTCHTLHLICKSPDYPSRHLVSFTLLLLYSQQNTLPPTDILQQTTFKSARNIQGSEFGHCWRFKGNCNVQWIVTFAIFVSCLSNNTDSEVLPPEM
jgi:hypothetical protein